MEFNFSLNILIPNYVTTHSFARVVNWIIYCQSRSITFFSPRFFRLLSFIVCCQLISLNISSSCFYALSPSLRSVRDVFMLIRLIFSVFRLSDLKSYHAIICNWRKGEKRRKRIFRRHHKEIFLRFSNIYCAICVCQWAEEMLDTRKNICLKSIKIKEINGIILCSHIKFLFIMLCAKEQIDSSTQMSFVTRLKTFLLSFIRFLSGRVSAPSIECEVIMLRH